MKVFMIGGTGLLGSEAARVLISRGHERTEGGKCWPIGWDNLTWNEMIAVAHKAMGCPGKKIVNIPRWMFTLGVKGTLKEHLCQHS